MTPFLSNSRSFLITYPCTLTLYFRSHPVDGNSSFLAKSPSLVSNNKPSESMSRRPTDINLVFSFSFNWSKIVGLPSGSLFVTKYPLCLLKSHNLVSTFEGKGWLFTSIWSFEVTFTLHSNNILLFTFTLPLTIKRSASLLEHKPDLAMTFAILLVFVLDDLVSCIMFSDSLGLKYFVSYFHSYVL